jgi:hypothetical protein
MPTGLIRPPITNHTHARALYFNIFVLFIFLLPDLTEPRIRPLRPFSRVQTRRTIFPLVFQMFYSCSQLKRLQQSVPARHYAVSQQSHIVTSHLSDCDTLHCQPGTVAHILILLSYIPGPVAQSV